MLLNRIFIAQLEACEARKSVVTYLSLESVRAHYTAAAAPNGAELKSVRNPR